MMTVCEVDVVDDVSTRSLFAFETY